MTKVFGAKEYWIDVSEEKTMVRDDIVNNEEDGDKPIVHFTFFREPSSQFFSAFLEVFNYSNHGFASSPIPV